MVNGSSPARRVNRKMTQTASSTNFVNVGERTNVTGSAAFKKMILAAQP
jgi:cobalamin-dependent methionine synthase I